MDRRHLNFVCLLAFCSMLFVFYCSEKKQTGPKISQELLGLDFRSPEGDRLDPAFWKEKKKVLYFGFSHCPDMCPTALTSFGHASLILGDKANRYKFVFVSLDPERDSPERLKTYVTQFPGKNLTALSPTQETMEKLHEVFPILHRKVSTNGSYMIDHTNLIFIIDEQLNQIASFPGGVSANTLAQKLRDIDSM